MLGIARSVLALLWKEMLYRARYPISLLNLAVSPFLIVGPYVMVAKMYGASEEFQVSVAVGLILWYWLSELFWIVGFAFRDEMEEGVLGILAVVPAGLGCLLAAKFLDALCISSYITAFMIIWFRIFAVQVATNWAQAVVLVCSAVALGAFSVLYAGIVLLAKRASAVGSLTQQALGILSGMTFSVSRLPRVLQLVAGLLPLTYGIRAMRTVTVTHCLVSVWADLLKLLLLAAAMLPLGVALLGVAIRRAKVDGTMEMF